MRIVEIACIINYNLNGYGSVYSSLSSGSLGWSNQIEFLYLSVSLNFVLPLAKDHDECKRHTTLSFDPTSYIYIYIYIYIYMYINKKSWSDQLKSLSKDRICTDLLIHQSTWLYSLCQCFHLGSNMRNRHGKYIVTRPQSPTNGCYLHPVIEKWEKETDVILLNLLTG